MSKEYLYPKVGPGLRNPLSRGTGPSQHGQIVNPPRFMKFGGFDGSERIKHGNDDYKPKVQKPGFEK